MERDLLDAMPIPTGPCVVVWRRAEPHGPDHAFHVLLQAMICRNPEAVLVVMGPHDGFDMLDEDDMRRIGWMRTPRTQHPSLG